MQHFEKGGALLCTAQVAPAETCIGKSNSCGSEGNMSQSLCCDGLQCAQDFIRGGGLFCVAGEASETCIAEDFSCGHEGDIAPQPCCDDLVCSQNYEKGGVFLCTAKNGLLTAKNGPAETCIDKADSC